MKKRSIKIAGVVLALSIASASLCGCDSAAANPEETAIVVNGEEIPFGLANFTLRYQQAQTYYYMQMLGMQSDGMWSRDMEDGSGNTYAETFKQSALDSIVKLEAVKQKAINEYNVVLTDEEEQKIADTTTQFLEANPTALEDFDTTEEQIKDMLRLNAYARDIRQYLTGDVDRNVTDDEASQSKVIYCRIAKAADTEEDYEATNAARLEETKQVLEKVKADDTLDAEGVNAAADEIDTEFFAMSYSYGADETSLDSQVVEAAAALSDGSWCDSVIETDGYYYIVKMVNKFDRDATDQKKESIIKERENTAVQECFQKWTDEAQIDVKSCWDSIAITDKEIYTAKAPVQTDEQTSSEAASETSAQQ